MNHKHEDEEEIEIEFSFEPIPEALDDLGISADEFDQAVSEAIERFDQSAPLESVPVTVKGATYELADVARIFIRGELHVLRAFFCGPDELSEDSELE